MEFHISIAKILRFSWLLAKILRFLRVEGETGASCIILRDISAKYFKCSAFREYL